MENLIELIKELERSQYQTNNPESFERALAISFESLGLPSQHLGGPNEPDILIEYDGEKVTVDAKTSRGNSGITEQMIGFPAQKRYCKKYNAFKSAVIAPLFRRGNVLATAKEEGVILIETKTICKILYNHNIYPYTPREIFNMLFKGGRIMVTPADIKTSLGEEQKVVVEIIKDLLMILEKRDIGEFTKERIQDIFIGREKDYKEKEIIQSLKLLLKLNILEEKEQKYRLTRNINDILTDINILCSARGVIEQNETQGKNSRGKGKGRKLDHVLEVVKLMKQGVDHPKAVKIVADKFDVAYQTISDQCARSLGLKSVDNFRELYQKGKLENYLKQKFPSNKPEIEEVFR